MSSLSEYNARVNEFVGSLKSSPTIVATLWNTMWNTLDDERDDLDAADVTDIINDGGIDTITKKQMEAKLLENGWDAADVADTMQQDLVAMDDSYRRTFLLNVTDPNNPVVVNLCEFEAFADKCGDAGYEWDGVLTWKALQEFAPVFLAAGHIVVTQDAEVISFPLPTLPTGGRRKTRRARNRVESCDFCRYFQSLSALPALKHDITHGSPTAKAVGDSHNLSSFSSLVRKAKKRRVTRK